MARTVTTAAQVSRLNARYPFTSQRALWMKRSLDQTCSQLETDFCLTTPKEMRKGPFVYLTFDNIKEAKAWILTWPQWITKYPNGYRKSLRKQVEQSPEFKAQMKKSSKKPASAVQPPVKRARASRGRHTLFPFGRALHAESNGSYVLG